MAVNLHVHSLTFCKISRQHFSCCPPTGLYLCINQSINSPLATEGVPTSWLAMEKLRCNEESISSKQQSLVAAFELLTKNWTK
ncbi:hypothetical protein T4B_14136 [Trichinella pseudospiralis]|uniref:Uncharacterized protein n=1 Tax=Trichinella pseudospiralis TaxID=6337 RepID=A0A0V1IDE8_TRIPS|nr:hypothetical protein T4B_14136 [Trichinella pseudospiralis]